MAFITATENWSVCLFKLSELNFLSTWFNLYLQWWVASDIRIYVYYYSTRNQDWLELNIEKEEEIFLAPLWVSRRMCVFLSQGKWRGRGEEDYNNWWWSENKYYFHLAPNCLWHTFLICQNLRAENILKRLQYCHCLDSIILKNYASYLSFTIWSILLCIAQLQ